MRLHTFVALVCGCALWTFAQACEIENPVKTELGVSKGVAGRCSNNGLEITCNFKDGEGWTCDGPEGSYSGVDMLITAGYACGC
jgi:hypothetical protein